MLTSLQSLDLPQFSFNLLENLILQSSFVLEFFNKLFQSTSVFFVDQINISLDMLNTLHDFDELFVLPIHIVMSEWSFDVLFQVCIETIQFRVNLVQMLSDFDSFSLDLLQSIVFLLGLDHLFDRCVDLTVIHGCISAVTQDTFEIRSCT